MKSSLFVRKIIDKYIKDEELKRLLITHSEKVGDKAIEIVESCGLAGKVDKQELYDSAMLHDIGIVNCNAPAIHCHGSRPYICHGIEGGKILRFEGLEDSYARICERHTGAGLTAGEIEKMGLPLPKADYLPETLQEKIICYADKFYSKSGDPTREKDINQIIGSLGRHGEEVVARFMELHNMFSCEN